MKQDIELPNQRVSFKKKQQEEHYKATIDYYIRLAYSLNDKEATLANLQAANGIVDDETFKYVLNPFSTEDDKLKNLPGEIRDFDFITPIKEKNIGEYILLPYTYTVTVENEELVLLRDLKLKQELEQKVQEQFIMVLNQLMGSQQEGQQQEPPDFEKLRSDFLKSWQEEKAIDAKQRLDLLNQITDFEFRRIKGYFYWWATEEFYTYRELDEYGRMNIQLINPLEGYPILNGNEFVEDGDGFAHIYNITWSEFIDYFRDRLSDKDRNYIKELIDKTSSDTPVIADVNTLRLRFGEPYMERFNKDKLGSSSYMFSTSNREIVVHRIQYKAETKVKFVTRINQLNQIEEFYADEEYQFNEALGDIDIKEEWINVPYEAYRFSNEDCGVYIPPRRITIDRRDKNNPSICKLTFGGKKGLFEGNIINPVPKRILPHQALSRIINLNIERTLAKYKSDIMLMPQGLINPDTVGTTQEKYFMMHADNTLIYDETAIDFNTVAQGVRIIGNQGLEKYISTLLEVRETIKREAWELANMNDERAGRTNPNAGKFVSQQNMEMAKLGSILSMTIFNKVLEKEHTADLELSKIAWIDGFSGQVYDKNLKEAIQVVVDGLSHNFSDYGVFVVNSKAEEEKLMRFKELAFSAAQNGDMEMAGQAIMLDSVPEIGKAIKTLTEARKQFEAEMQQREAQNRQQELAMIEEGKEKDRQKDITVAQIRANSVVPNVPAEEKEDNQVDNQLDNNLKTHDSLMKQQGIQNRSIENSRKDAIKLKDIEAKERIAKINKNRYDK